MDTKTSLQNTDENLAPAIAVKSKFTVIAIASVVALCVTGAVASVIIYKPAHTKKIEEPIVTKDFENDLPPPGFMPVVQKEVPPAPPPVLVEAKDLFKEIKPQIDPLVTKRQESINQFIANRNKANRASAGGVVVTYAEKGGADYSIQNIDQIRNMDKDYSAQKVPAG